MIGMTAAMGIGSFVVDGDAMSTPFTAIGNGCDIKGNVSIETGERIYHVPGQKFYDATRIRADYGERWFCTEAEARRAGWRKSRR